MCLNKLFACPAANHAHVQVPFELLGPIYPLLEQHGAHKADESYDAAAGVGMVVSVEAGRAACWRCCCNDGAAFAAILRSKWHLPQAVSQRLAHTQHV